MDGLERLPDYFSIVVDDIIKVGNEEVKERMTGSQIPERREE